MSAEIYHDKFHRRSYLDIHVRFVRRLGLNMPRCGALRGDSHYR